MTKVKIIVFIFFSLLCLCFSCEEEAPRLSRWHNKVVDSLVQERKVGMREMLDSICDLRFAEKIDAATDSIVKERMAEIRKKIEADAKKN